MRSQSKYAGLPEIGRVLNTSRVPRPMTTRATIEGYSAERHAAGTDRLAEFRSVSTLAARPFSLESTLAERV
jgi:hypothetical protein